MTSEALNFDSLVIAIKRTHSALAEQASKAVNLSLTLRNWMIGYYIQEYEQSGTDRAAYGERLLESLSERLQSGGLKRVEARELRRFRQFYLAYPQIRETASPERTGGPAAFPSIWQTLSTKLANTPGDIREIAAHRHPAVHPQEPRAGRICAGRHEQHPVRLPLSGATAGQGGNGGFPAQSGGRVGGRR